MLAKKTLHGEDANAERALGPLLAKGRDLVQQTGPENQIDGQSERYSPT